METENVKMQDNKCVPGAVALILQDRAVYVVGSRCFQNELLSFVLQNRLGVQCVTFNSVLCGKEVDDVSINKKVLVLLDANGKEAEELLADIEGDYSKLISCFLVALINVSPGMGVERGALCSGVKGFFYLNDSIDLFIKGVQAIFNSELWVSREVLSKCVQGDSIHYAPRKDVYKNRYSLSKRELEILALVTVGAKNDEIAYKLCISAHTVKTHLYNVFKKIHVNDRLQAALWAAKHL